MSDISGDPPIVPHPAPLLKPERLDLPVVIHGQRSITGAEFLAASARIAESLPEHRYVVNLCCNRAHFLFGFAAALTRGQTSLLPPNRADGTLRMLRDRYPDSYALVDDEGPAAGFETVRLEIPRAGVAAQSAPNPLIPGSHEAAVVFTSGSTGTAQDCIKTWDIFGRSVDLIARHLDLASSPPHQILATVPPQHMYGLETTILLPLCSASVLTDHRAFYPADIHRALDALPRPRMLVTTPLHLRACLEDGGKMPSADLIVSATAPLSSTLARAAEEHFGARLLEIYGFSEAGSVAVRRTAREEHWTLFDGLRIVTDADQRHQLEAPYLPQPVALQDRVEPIDQTHFRLLGRLSDQINVAGKRTSVAALNAALHDIEGVRDGVFFMSENTEGAASVPRLTAFVVAPGLSREQVLSALRQRIDPAFLPRPITMVDALPRLENGKLKREDLEALAKRFQHAQK